MHFPRSVNLKCICRIDSACGFHTLQLKMYYIKSLSKAAFLIQFAAVTRTFLCNPKSSSQQCITSNSRIQRYFLVSLLPFSLLPLIFFSLSCQWPNNTESNCRQKTTFNDYVIRESNKEKVTDQYIQQRGRTFPDTPLSDNKEYYWLCPD